MTSDPESLFAQLLARIGRPGPEHVKALCSAHPDLKASIELLYQDWVDFERLASQAIVTADLEAGPGTGGESAARVRSRAYPQSVLDALVDRLLRRRRTDAGLRRAKELARGGMGVVDVVRDDVLRRTIAVKSVRREVLRDGAEEYRALLTGRLIEEAQITAQLDHPAIVPVHDLSVDENGEPWFSMKLVRGETFAEYLDGMSDEERRASIPRVLSILIAVARALAYAHDKGVVHRDVKPSNIMVGRYGEVYLMDWGLAHLVQDDEYLGASSQDSARGVHLSYLRDNDEYLESGFDGAVVGTPAYMSPEQAIGSLEQISRSTDVYALGAVLYRALAGKAPYEDVVASGAPTEIVESLLQGPPTPVEKLDPRVNRELAAICGRAIARNPSDRYPTVAEFADDLTSFQEGRVVAALGSGAWAAVAKWGARNRRVVAPLAVLLALFLLVGGARMLLSPGGQLLQDNQARVEAASRLAALRARADTLWPPSPDAIRDLEAWMRDARDLVAGLGIDRAESEAGHVAALRRLRAAALPLDPERTEEHRRTHPLAPRLEEARTVSSAGGRTAGVDEIERLELRIDLDLPFEFADDQLAWWHARRVELIGGLLDLSRPDVGLMDGEGVIDGGGRSVEARLRLAREMEEAMAPGGSWRERWAEAIAAIRVHPDYGGLELVPQTGLLPLEPDPVTGLWEFAHQLSGSAPPRRLDGPLAMTADSGLVFILVPGGDVLLGGQADDAAAPNFDPLAQPGVESPPARATVEPFFLAKYELHRTQWRRWVAGDSAAPGSPSPELIDSTSELHPMPGVTHDRAVDLCRWLGLRLPTEAEWEHAARCYSTAAFVSGPTVEGIEGFANLADAALAREVPGFDGRTGPFDDGWPRTSPVGSFAPNGFGLHDVTGNVWEWCRVTGPLPGRDGLPARIRVLRGGGWASPPEEARFARRRRVERTFTSDQVGLRPARSIQR